jgi:hypothetical protein
MAVRSEGKSGIRNGRKASPFGGVDVSVASLLEQQYRQILEHIGVEG